MLKKEFQEVLKQSLVYIGLSVGIPLVLKVVLAKEIGSYFEVFFLMYQYSLLLFSIFMGLSLFLPDRNQRAEDYVYSLPYSRLRVLVMKVVPRLAAVAIFYLLFLLLYLWGGQEIIMRSSFFSTSWFYWLLFGISLSFSASADSYLKVGGATLLGTLIFLVLFTFVPNLIIQVKGGDLHSVGLDVLSLFKIDFSYNLVPFLLVCLCLMLPFLISFVLAFKKWGIQSKENYNKGFLKLFVPLIAAGFIVSTFFVYVLRVRDYPDYYLTANHRLIETSPYSTRLYGAEGVKLKYSKGGFSNFFEDEAHVYGTHETRRSVYIVRIDKENHTVETMGKIPRPKIKRFQYEIRLFRNFIAIPEHFHDDQLRAFVFIDTRRKTIKRMKTADVLPPGYKEPIIFGADHSNGKIFWLIHGRLDRYPIIKLWEDGTTEKLGMTRWAPKYFNRMLFTFQGRVMVISKITDNGLEVIRKIYYHKHISLKSVHRRINLYPVSLKEVYGVWWQKGGKANYVRLDLETFEISPVKDIPTSHFFLNNLNGTIYGIKFQYEKDEPGFHLKKLYRLEEGKLHLVKEFPEGKNKKKSDRFWISKGGIVIRQNKRLSFYSLPGMKPLKFKGFD